MHLDGGEGLSLAQVDSALKVPSQHRTLTNLQIVDVVTIRHKSLLRLDIDQLFEILVVDV